MATSSLLGHISTCKDAFVGSCIWRRDQACRLICGLTGAIHESPGAFLETRPLGIILGIEPWNFPYYQIARVAGPQLMVGNVLILKHAENVPQCALAFARLFELAGAPPGAYTNIFASLNQIGRVIEDSRVCGVTVTGSERAGAAVAERAGRNLKKSVMELGGSDPFLVLEDAPLETSIDAAIFGRMFNTGQSCVSSKRIIVIGKERGKAFLDGFVQRMAALEAGIQKIRPQHSVQYRPKNR